MTFDGLIVDNFAGGGGASSGWKRPTAGPWTSPSTTAPKRSPLHKANHPETEHIRQNIWQVDPDDIRRRGPVAVAWFSPDCTHHSKAKGGRPIRDAAAAVQPRPRLGLSSIGRSAQNRW